MGSHTSDSNRGSPGTSGAGQDAHRHQPGPNRRPEVVIGDVLPCDDLSRRLGIIYRMALARAKASAASPQNDAAQGLEGPGAASDRSITDDQQI